MKYSVDTKTLGLAEIHPRQFELEEARDVKEKADALRHTILSMPDSDVSPYEQIYYISPKGDDNADGMTPETAWRTLAHLDEISTQLKPNTAILFERGQIHRGYFGVSSGCFYGAYGRGTKPILTSSIRNYADEQCWTLFKDSIWCCDARDKQGENLWDIGLICFDDGEAIGIKKGSIELLEEDFDYFHDVEHGKLYLRYAQGTPFDRHQDIEICPCRHVIYGYDGICDVKIENLAIKYTGAHGMGFARNMEHFSISGCEIGWIGGSRQGTDVVRYGNGIEFWDNCTDIVLDHNWVYQCYDAGITHQGAENAVQKKIRFTNNLIEKCVYGIEVFVYDNGGHMEDICYENNIIRHSGYGWGNQRTNPEAQSAVNGWNRTGTIKDFVIRNNIMESSRWYLFHLKGKGSDKKIQIRNNSYYQIPGEHAAAAFWINDEILPAENEEEFQASVRQMDDCPATVTWLSADNGEEE